jgi:hypothetical protein
MSTAKLLKDSDLLIDAVSNGTTLTAENWKSVMTAIKDAVNNNANILGVTSSTVTISKNEDVTKPYYWVQDLNQGYSVVIDKKTIGKENGDTVQPTFYNNLGTEVSLNYNQNAASIFIYSRVDAEITVIFK